MSIVDIFHPRSVSAQRRVSDTVASRCDLQGAYYTRAVLLFAIRIIVFVALHIVDNVQFVYVLLNVSFN